MIQTHKGTVHLTRTATWTVNRARMLDGSQKGVVRRRRCIESGPIIRFILISPNINIKGKMSCETIIKILIPPDHSFYNIPWISCQIRKITACACAGNGGNIFPAIAS